MLADPVFLLAAIIWMSATIFASLVLCHIIVQFISKKPTVQLTLIDLIYKDCIHYLFTASLTFALAVSCCLVNFINR